MPPFLIGYTIRLASDVPSASPLVQVLQSTLQYTTVSYLMRCNLTHNLTLLIPNQSVSQSASHSASNSSHKNRKLSLKGTNHFPSASTLQYPTVSKFLQRFLKAQSDILPPESLLTSLNNSLSHEQFSKFKRFHPKCTSSSARALAKRGYTRLRTGATLLSSNNLGQTQPCNCVKAVTWYALPQKANTCQQEVHRPERWPSL